MGGMYWRECFGRNVEFGIQRCSLVFWGPDHHTAQMLVDLGPNVYMDEFETPFLLASASFYKLEAQEFISSCTCPEYLARTEKRLTEESDRVRNYLDPITETKIIRVVEVELVQQQVRCRAGAGGAVKQTS
eukprot:scaffold72307_cov20-Tisochrysis_lutea.AAC.3